MYPAERFQFVSENWARYPIAMMCRILGGCPGGYRGWGKSPAYARAEMDAALTQEIRSPRGVERQIWSNTSAD
jgi:hypothetical protein